MSYNSKYCVKILELIIIIFFSVEFYRQGTPSMMKSDKRLYTFFRRSNTENNSYMKYFYAYVKVVESYGGSTSIHPGFVRSNITEMGL